jgi:hypothetical protein
VVGGLDAGKYFWRSGREKCFSLDIPFYRTSGLLSCQWTHDSGHRFGEAGAGLLQQIDARLNPESR